MKAFGEMTKKDIQEAGGKAANPTPGTKDLKRRKVMVQNGKEGVKLELFLSAMMRIMPLLHIKE